MVLQRYQSILYTVDMETGVRVLFRKDVHLDKGNWSKLRREVLSNNFDDPFYSNSLIILNSVIVKST